MEFHTQAEREAGVPVIHIVSDSVGATAQAVARAAAAQFGVVNPRLETLSKAASFDEIRGFLEDHIRIHRKECAQERMLLFYTLVNDKVRLRVADYVDSHPDIVAVDLMTDAVRAISSISGMKPANTPGALREVNPSYFRRIEAMDFTIDHDDGRNPQDLRLADIVLVGVSRSSKTPLAIYLSQQGLKVANVPLDLASTPPRELSDVEKGRLFGLMTTPEVLIRIRRRRLGTGKASLIAENYADPEYVWEDLERAHTFMLRLGCIIIHTENRAVEETAQEILTYYGRAYPDNTAII